MRENVGKVENDRANPTVTLELSDQMSTSILSFNSVVETCVRDEYLIIRPGLCDGSAVDSPRIIQLPIRNFRCVDCT